MRKWPKSAMTIHVMLADGDTRDSIEAVVNVCFSLPNHTTLEIENVLYVPTLSTSLFSVQQHLAYNECSMRSHNNTLQLNFPDFNIDTAPTDFSFPCIPTNNIPDFTSVACTNLVHMMCNNVCLPR